MSRFTTWSQTRDCFTLVSSFSSLKWREPSKVFILPLPLLLPLHLLLSHSLSPLLPSPTSASLLPCLSCSLATGFCTAASTREPPWPPPLHPVCIPGHKDQQSSPGLPLHFLLSHSLAEVTQWPSPWDSFTTRHKLFYLSHRCGISSPSPLLSKSLLCSGTP
jgi:hypothetical protein